MIVRLAWPNPALAPNRSNGKHWSGVAAIKAKAKADAYMLAKAAPKGRFDKATRYPISILFVAPDKRRRDLDGLHGSMKHALDGIAQAIGVDDSQFGPVLLDMVPGDKPGSVIVAVGVTINQLHGAVLA